MATDAKRMLMARLVLGRSITEIFRGCSYAGISGAMGAQASMREARQRLDALWAGSDFADLDPIAKDVLEKHFLSKLDGNPPNGELKSAADLLELKGALDRALAAVRPCDIGATTTEGAVKAWAAKATCSGFSLEQIESVLEDRRNAVKRLLDLVRKGSV